MTHIGNNNLHHSQHSGQKHAPAQHAKSSELFPSPHEKQAVDKWLSLHHLDTYGKPQGTDYAGSNPLFNEATGKQTPRYTYLVQQYPGKPWLKQ